MAEIRAFTAEHLHDVTQLYMKVMRGRSGRGSQRLTDYFARIFLENPWVAEDLPSLVAFEGSALVGFIGVVPRQMQFKGNPIRVAVTSQFMVDREVSHGPVAMELLSRLFRGPQDLAYGDGASEEAQRVYAGVGGHGSGLYSFNWLRPLRPLQTVRTYLDRFGPLLRAVGSVTGVLTTPVGLIMSRLPAKVLRKPESPFTSWPVNASELLGAILEIGWREPLQPLYDPVSFEWLMAETAACNLGDLQMATVREPNGNLAGWYAYWVKSGGPASLLQFGVRRPNQADDMLKTLFRDAWERGASFVRGQSMPPYLVSLTNQYCLFRQPNTSVVFHSRDQLLLEAIYRGKAALSRLDGECWMRFSAENWD